MLALLTLTMVRQEQGDDIDYEVSQEQLDAVDRMLEELDMDEQMDRVPAAFQIVERLGQRRQQEQAMSLPQSNEDRIHVHHRRHDMDMDRSEENPDQQGMQQDGEEEEEYDAQPIGYIPLDQGPDEDNTDDDEEGEDGYQDEYHTMQSEDDDEASQSNGRWHGGNDQDSVRELGKDSASDDGDDDGQGYDGYLHSPLQNGNIPVPVIPSAIEIDIEENDAAAEKIPEEDLQTIAQVMSSFSLPAPDWARSIPEERWLPKIVQQATAPRKDT